MIKQLLVGLGNSDYSMAAARLACDLAKRHEARVIGLSVVNIPGIEAAYHTPRPLGAGSADADLHKKSLDDARQKSEEAISRFEELCKEAGVDHEGRQIEGDPAKEIIKASVTSDIVLIGRKTRFTCWLPEEEFCEASAEVIEKSLRPTILVPEQSRNIKKLMLAVDFQRLSEWLYFSFIHLNPYPEADVHLVHAATSKKDRQFPDELIDYFNIHGIKVTPVILTGDHVGQALVNYAQTENMDMVVMGIHTVSKVWTALLGSTGRYVLDHLDLPVLTQT